MRKAFDLTLEDPKTDDRCSQTLFGYSTLIARRRLEAGDRFIDVTWDLFWGPVNVACDAWDTHRVNFKILKQPRFGGKNSEPSQPRLLGLGDVQNKAL